MLLLIALRNGTESPEWDNALALADDLIWSVEPKSEQEERHKLLTMIPGLLKGIRQGLNNISYNQHQMNALFKELQGYHVKCLRGVSIEPEEVDVIDQSQISDEIVLKESVDEVPAESVPDQYDEQARSITIGSWLEIEKDDGIKSRIKLSWRSNVTGDCLFVNRKGLKDSELTLEGLAMLLREGRATVLGKPEQPLMDRALNAMVDALKKTGGETVADS